VIHCIGDSHASVFTGTDTLIAYPYPNINKPSTPYFTAYKLTGYASTAYNLGSKKDIIDSIVDEHIRKDDWLVFCFGETDCRSHIVKQGKDVIDHTVNSVVSRYINFISNYADRCNIAVFGPIAPSQLTSHGDDYYKTFGTHEERLYASRLLNSRLELECDKKSYKFFSIAEDMMDGEIVDTKYLLDEIHLNQKAMPLIMEKLKGIELL
jgi:hypothetical protein